MDFPTPPLPGDPSAPHDPLPGLAEQITQDHKDRIASMSKPGVDSVWIADCRAVVVETMRNGTAEPEWHARRAAAIADALAEERRKRGGARAEDLRSQAAEFMEFAPMITNGIVELIKALKKAERD
jgi:hypothetical protein